MFSVSHWNTPWRNGTLPCPICLPYSIEKRLLNSEPLLLSKYQPRLLIWLSEPFSEWRTNVPIYKAKEQACLGARRLRFVHLLQEIYFLFVKLVKAYDKMVKPEQKQILTEIFGGS